MDPVRLLVVEDDQSVADLMQEGLGAEGHAVEVVRTGDDAVARGTSGTYDAILLDYMLPGRSGLDVVRELRGRGIGTPILMVTARDLTEERAAIADAGVSDVLTKPFRFAELLGRIERLTGGLSGRSDGATGIP